MFRVSHRTMLVHWSVPQRVNIEQIVPWGAEQWSLTSPCHDSWPACRGALCRWRQRMRAERWLSAGPCSSVAGGSPCCLPKAGFWATEGLCSSFQAVPAFSSSIGLCSSRAHLAADLRETCPSFVSLVLSCCLIKGCKSVCRLKASRCVRQLKVCLQ